MSKFQEFKQKSKELQDFVKNHGTEMVKEMYQSIFDANPNLKYITTVGYVPGFNDGDACTFTCYSDTNKDYLENLDEDSVLNIAVELGLIKGEDEDEDFWDNDAEELVEKIGDMNPSMDYRERSNVTKDVNEDLLEEVHGDGFLLFVYRKEDGSVEILEQEYDCGY